MRKFRKFIRQTDRSVNGAHVYQASDGKGVINYGECGWLAFSGNTQSGMFESKEDAEMELLKLMFSEERGYEEGY